MSRFVVLMGVSGSGKSTVGHAVARRLGWTFAEGDDFHSPHNVEKMSMGIPLTDTDRWPWLRAIGQWMDERAQASESALITCSALRRAYRNVLSEGREVQFIELDVSEAELRRRLLTRTNHYMPASLLDSQLETFEPLSPSEVGVRVSGEGPLGDVVGRVWRAT